MVALITFLLLFIATSISVTILGLLAGFSPTLYIAQITAGVSKHPKSDFRYTIAIMIGVVIAIILLMFLFQIFHLETLLNFINSTVSALAVSVIFNILVGIALIFGGFWYINYSETPKTKLKNMKSAGGLSAMAGLGFARTFLSISGVTATFIAAGIISNASSYWPERIALTLIFLAASIIPFAAILYVLRRNPAKLHNAIVAVKKLLKKFNYRPVIGTIAVLLGASIIIFNIMMALFY